MKWLEYKPKKEDRINEQAINLLSDDSVICTVMFAVKENEDGSRSPLFLVSKNFIDPKIFIEDFIKLLGEHAKFNQRKSE